MLRHGRVYRRFILSSQNSKFIQRFISKEMNDLRNDDLRFRVRSFVIYKENLTGRAITIFLANDNVWDTV